MMLRVVGVDQPVFHDAVGFVGGEFHAAVARGGGGGKHFDDKHRREIGVGLAQARDLLGGEVGEVGQKCVARAEADGDCLAVQLTEVKFLDVLSDEAFEKVHVMSVAEGYG